MKFATIVFYCEDVPPGAIFECACDSPDLKHHGVPFEIKRGGMIAKYAYFKNVKK